MIKKYETYTVNGKQKDIIVWYPDENGPHHAIIFFHGLGAAGVPITSLNEGLAKALNNGLQIPFIVFAGVDSNGWVNPDTEGAPLYDYVSGRSDVKEIFATGLSSGANAVYRMLAASFKFAAVVPISINSNEFRDDIPVMCGCPVWHFHGNRDGSPNLVGSSEGFIEEYNIQFPGKAKRTVFRDLAHNAWDATYASDMNKATVSGDPVTFAPFDENIYTWMLKQVSGVEPEPPTEIPMDSMKLIGDEIIATFGDRKFKIVADEVT